MNYINNFSNFFKMSVINIPFELQENINAIVIDLLRNSKAKQALIKEINNLKYGGFGGFNYGFYTKKVFRYVEREMYIINCADNLLRQYHYKQE